MEVAGMVATGNGNNGNGCNGKMRQRIGDDRKWWHLKNEATGMEAMVKGTIGMERTATGNDIMGTATICGSDRYYFLQKTDGDYRKLYTFAP